MANHLVVEGLTKKQNDIMYDIMYTEAAGIEGIFEDPRFSIKDAYEMMRDGEYKVEDAEGALAFTYLIKDNEEPGIMKEIEKLHRSGLSLSEVKEAMKAWQGLFFTEVWKDEVADYEGYLSDKRVAINKSNQNTFVIKERLQILAEIEKCMKHHLKWGWTMDIFEKYVVNHKAVTKIQSRRRGNKDRYMLEKTGKWYQDSTSHWKKTNEAKVRKSLEKEMIDDTMTDAKKAQVMDDINTLMKDKGFRASGKKKTRKKPKGKSMSIKAQGAGRRSKPQGGRSIKAQGAGRRRKPQGGRSIKPQGRKKAGQKSKKRNKS